MISLLALFDAHEGRCTYCGCDTYVPGIEPRSATAERFGITLGVPGCKKLLRYRRATREHLVRVADGGGDNRRNLELACQFCNVQREEATPDQHRAAIARMVAAGIHPNHADLAGLPKRKLWRERRAARLSRETEASHVG